MVRVTEAKAGGVWSLLRGEVTTLIVTMTGGMADKQILIDKKADVLDVKVTGTEK
jgi:hypothetical protein